MNVSFDHYFPANWCPMWICLRIAWQFYQDWLGVQSRKATHLQSPQPCTLESPCTWQKWIFHTGAGHWLCQGWLSISGPWEVVPQVLYLEAECEDSGKEEREWMLNPVICWIKGWVQDQEQVLLGYKISVIKMKRSQFQPYRAQTFCAPRDFFETSASHKSRSLRLNLFWSLDLIWSS